MQAVPHSCASTPCDAVSLRPGATRWNRKRYRCVRYSEAAYGRAGIRVDIGQGQAAALWEQAGAGTFRMDSGAAKRCADVFVQFADSLEDELTTADETGRAEGFGGFVSAIQLQTGFRDKGALLTEALVGLQEAALRMAAAYLRAGQLFEEADDMNRRALTIAGEGVAE